MTVKELADKLAKIIAEGHGDRETCVYDDGLQVMGVELSNLHFDGKHFQQVIAFGDGLAITRNK